MNVLIRVGMVISVSLACRSNAFADCSDDFGNLARSAEKVPKPSNEIGYIWYPKSDFKIFGHIEIAVDEMHWDATAGFHRSASAEAAARAAGLGSKGFYRFTLKATDQEMEKMRRYVASNPKFRGSLSTCVSGVCKAISTNMGFIIPPPFKESPFLSAIYLTSLKVLGFSRISKIEYVGKNEFKNLFLTTEIPGELSFATALGGGGSLLVIAGINAAGEQIKKYVVVPPANVPDRAEEGAGETKPRHN